MFSEIILILVPIISSYIPLRKWHDEQHEVWEQHAVIDKQARAAWINA